MKSEKIEGAISGFLLIAVFTAICFSIILVKEPTGEIPSSTHNDSTIQKGADSFYLVTLTTYNPTPSQGWGNGLVTFDGSKIDTKSLKRKSIKWCAVSHDLIHLMGKTILIPEYGYYEVHDLMHKRHKNKIDILVHPVHGNFKKDSVIIRTI